MNQVQIGEILPGAEDALVSEDKVRGYILNPEHVTGTHKARVFYSALGYGAEEWESLADQIRQGVTSTPVSRTEPCYNGTRCSVTILVEGPNGSRRHVMTGWRVPDDGSAPHLITAYVLTRLGND